MIELQTEDQVIDKPDNKHLEKEYLEQAYVHYEFLKRLAVQRLTYNVDGAEDLVQDTFVRAYEKFHLFELGTNCKQWLIRIMFNIHYSKHLKTVNRQKHADNFQYEIVKEHNKQVEFHLFEYMKYMERLNNRHQLVISLVDIEGMTMEECSETLMLPLGTVKSTLHRARKKLKELMKDSFNNN